ncbi:protein of unknown function [Flexibacter flexilis DSM 6793]|uniref:DUF4421 domain-containing protein n=1 Tax=Flexibacter flexilis DSM 6793 TaxID=927664 RepID=A0A1I1LKV9_9BACT|nr:DUF4421 family protein [Flexibacter flexilis]SFC73671.1 protein of unknown function [Flexibacter flexilis DSM 6793]
MQKKVFSVTFLLLIINCLIENQAQAQMRLINKIIRPDIDTNYITLYPRKLMTYTAISRKYLSFYLRNKRNTAVARYNPNVNNNLNFGVLYSGIGLEYSFFTFKKDNKEDLSLYGSTYLRDFQLNLYAQQFGIDLVSQNYKGFYLNNPQDFNKTWEKGNVYPQRDDIKVTNQALNFYYILNYRKFSYQSAFRQTRHQCRSAGSVMLMAGASNYSIEADSNLIPYAADSTKFRESETFLGGRFIDFSILGGYGHTFVWRRWYVSGTVLGGFGVQAQKYQTAIEDKRGVRGIGRLYTRFAAGYNDRRFFTGVSYLLDRKTTQVDKLVLGGELSNLRFFMGVRF